MTIIEKEAFWRWGFSNLLSNSLRGILAEYIVAKALGCDTDGGERIEWDTYDLTSPRGLRIEVKSSAYLQSWHRPGSRPSKLLFGIAPRMKWDSATGKYDSQPIRHADHYVFAVFTATDRELANPLDVTQWFFVPVSAERLNHLFGTQKSVSLSAIERHGHSRLSFQELSAHFAAL